MAGPMIALEIEDDTYSFCFLYAIPAGILITIPGTALHPVYSPSDALPEYAAIVTTTAEKAALDAGTAIFVTRSYKLLGTTEEKEDEVRTQYAKLKARLSAEYTGRFKLVGQRYEEI